MTEEWIAAWNASISWDEPATSNLDPDDSNDVKYEWQDKIEYWDSVS